MRLLPISSESSPPPALVAVLVVAVLAALTDAFQPTSFTFDRIRYTFYPGEIARTWTEADAFCQSLNKELAVFANRGQIRNVSEYLSPEGGVWTGYKTNGDGRFEAAELAEFEWKKEFGTPLLSRARPYQCGLLSVANYTGIVATDCDTRKAALCSVSDPDIVEVETMMDAKSGLAPTAPKPTAPKLSVPANNKTSSAKRAGYGADDKSLPAPAPKPTPEAARSKKPVAGADEKSSLTPKKAKKAATATDEADIDDDKHSYKSAPKAKSSKTESTEPKSSKTESTEPKSSKTESTEPKSSKTELTEPKSSKTESTEPKSSKTESTPAEAKSFKESDDDHDNDSLASNDDPDSKKVAEERRKAQEERKQALEDKRQAEADRKKAEDERKRAEDERRKAAEERKRAADDKKKAAEDKKKLADAKKKVKDTKKKANKDKKKAKEGAEDDADIDKKDGDAEATKTDGDESSESLAPTPAPTTSTPTNQLPVQVESEGDRFTFFPNHIMFGGYMEYSRFCEDKGLQPAVFRSRKQLDDIASHVQSVVMVWTGYTTDTMGGFHSADERNGPWSDEFAVPDADPAPGLSCGALATIGERVGVTMGSCASAHEALCSAKPFADTKAVAAPAPLKKK